jgi:NADH-quinone oxidoreductase subunit H
MPAFPLGKNKRKILNKVIFNQWMSTIIIEDIILVVLRFDAYGYVFYTLLKGKLRLASRSCGPNRAGKVYNLADGLKLFSKEEFEPNT